MAKSRLDRKDAAEYARLCWRAKLASLGLLRLAPILSDKKARPTDEEKSVYGACLVQAGAVREGTALLESLKSKAHARVSLFLAFAAMTRWEHAKAVKPLRKILRARGLDEYDRLVAHLNLAACWVQTGDHGAADELVKELLERFQGDGFGRVRTNLLALGAENAFRAGQTTDAERYLAVAKQNVVGRSGLEGLQIRKLKWAVECVKKGVTPQRLTELDAIRREALRLGLWDSVRDADAYRAVYGRELEWLLRVYFGTPFASYRERLLDDYGPVDLPDFFVWNAFGRGPSGQWLDLESGLSHRGEKILRLGHADHRLVVCLASDFYRPFRLGTLYEAAYPDEPFEPTAAQRRIRQLVWKTRKSFADHALALTIDEVSGGYRLAASQPFGVRVSLDAPAVQPKRKAK